MILVITPPTVSIPWERGVTSNNNTSLVASPNNDNHGRVGKAGQRNEARQESVMRGGFVVRLTNVKSSKRSSDEVLLGHSMIFNGA